MCLRIRIAKKGAPPLPSPQSMRECHIEVMKCLECPPPVNEQEVSPQNAMRSREWAGGWWKKAQNRKQSCLGTPV